MSSSRGRLIVIEGLDRAGKSTQVDLLVTNLCKAGHKVEKLRFPNRTTPIGQSINTYLTSSTDPSDSSTTNDHVIHLLFSANRWEASRTLVSKLSSGTTLIVDRYSFSGAVYSAAKDFPGLGLDWCWSMEVGLPRPDLVLFLRVSEDVQLLRGGFGNERYENERMQRGVRMGFDELWRRWTGRVEIVDADGTLESVQAEIVKLVDGVMAEESKELGVLERLKER